MTGSNRTPNNKVFSSDDPLDINELAALDEEISNEFIEQLQNQIATKANIRNDGDLFEEPKEPTETPADNTNTASAEDVSAAPTEDVSAAPTDNTTDNTSANSTDNISQDESAAAGINIGFNSDIDDNFIKKYKARLNKKNHTEEEDEAYSKSRSKPEEPEDITPIDIKARSTKGDGDIEAVSGGNIVEKPITDDYLEYKDSLDYVDGNVKYSKYVVYIDPENRDFMDSLTVKERKNLINRIIREQDSIAITKRNINKMQTIMVHVIIAILTVTAAIPCIYWAINASLEATINNYRSSQSAFEQLYKDYGKIKTKP